MRAEGLSAACLALIERELDPTSLLDKSLRTDKSLDGDLAFTTRTSPNSMSDKQ